MRLPAARIEESGMTAITKFLAGGVAAAALMGAAPAAAQYYPGYGYPGYGGNPVGQVINQVLGGGYGGHRFNPPGAGRHGPPAGPQRPRRGRRRPYHPRG